jgi:uncharacterized protein (DUF1810 family)
MTGTPPPRDDDLERFVHAQQAVWDRVIEELRQGTKRTHWMWYVFPQLRGLGRSDMARRFGIASVAEARAYMAHPLLGPRLLECCAILERLQGRTALAIFDSVDELKLRSCLTLFERAAPGDVLFVQLIEKYFGGVRDRATLARLDDARAG